MGHDLRAREAIYFRIGGAPTVGAVVDLVYDSVGRDPELSCLARIIGPDRFKDPHRLFLSQVLGGPDVYKGPDLHQAHAHAALTDRQIDRLVLHLSTALRQVGVGPGIVAQIVWILEYIRPELLGIT